ncbi:Sec15-like subunit of exocyst complex [Chloropicon primus]|nr:Sec15-like subunit of exocyst complex [Chloropicon primus]
MATRADHHHHHHHQHEAAEEESTASKYVERLSERVSRALDHQDLTTVLRAALELQETSKGEGDGDGDEDGGGVCVRGGGGGGVDAEEEGEGEEAVQRALDLCIAEDSKEIELLCRKNCSDFVETMDELSGIKVEAEQLKRQIEKHCDFVVKRNEPELKLLNDLAACYGAVEAHNKARVELESTIQVLELLCSAEKGSNALEGFEVLDLLELLDQEREQKRQGLTKASHAEAANGVGGKEFDRWLVEAISDVRLRLLSRTSEEFNKWLLNARTQQRSVARRKLDQVRRRMKGAAGTIARHQETLKRVREDWGLPLKDMLAKALEGSEQGREGKSTNPFEREDAGGADGENGFAVGLREDDEDGKDGVLSDLDFTILHRCRYLYSRLGMDETFANNYRHQRRLQLRSDLEQKGGSSPFLDQFSDQMERILGFIIIEDKVLHSTQGMISPEDIVEEWEEALQVLVARLSAWLSSRTNFLAQACGICTHVALASTVASHFGLNVEPLKSLINTAVEEYAETLQKESTEWITAICKEDLQGKLKPSLLTKVQASGSAEGWYLGGVEGVARYSACVPEVVNLMLGLLKDGLSLVEGTRIGEDLTFPLSFYDEDAVTEVGDIALSIANFVILPQVKEMVKDEQNDLREASQMMANIYFGFIPALHGLETFVATLCSSRGDQVAATKEMRRESEEAFRNIMESPEYVSRKKGKDGEAGSLPRALLDILYEVMDLTEENVLEILCAKVDSYSANYIMMDWCPSSLGEMELVEDQATSSGGGNIDEVCKESECAREIVAFIKKMSQDSKKYMPEYLHMHLFSQVFQHAADHILQLLSCSAVSRFNLISMVQLKADMRHLKALAVKTLEDDDVDILFAGLVQVLDYLLSCAPESILDPAVKLSLYPTINNQVLGRLLCKYQEIPKDHSAIAKMPFLGKAPAKATINELSGKLLSNV